MLSIQETHLGAKNTNRLTVKGWKKIFTQTVTKDSGVGILISDETDFKSKII